MAGAGSAQSNRAIGRSLRITLCDYKTDPPASEISTDIPGKASAGISFRMTAFIAEVGLFLVSTVSAVERGLHALANST